MIDALITLLSSPMMQRSLLAAIIVGVTAPIIGTYLVHRRLAMLGDGIGHISLTGVALGWLLGAVASVTPANSWAIPGAIVVSVLGAVAIELVRQSGRTSGDTALAMLFYGGIAGGVLLIGLAGGTSAQLNSYLFGSISTVRWSDISLISILGVAIIALGLGLAPALFSVTNDEDFARSTGLPVRGRDEGRRVPPGERPHGHSRRDRSAGRQVLPFHDGHRDGTGRHNLHMRAFPDVLRRPVPRCDHRRRRDRPLCRGLHRQGGPRSGSTRSATAPGARPQPAPGALRSVTRPQEAKNLCNG